MKTPDGWIRGRWCGKYQPVTGDMDFFCEMCGHWAKLPNDLCYPVKREVIEAKPQ